MNLIKESGKLFSPGKLLLTSEYVVLDGALALSVPTLAGQEFFFDEVDDAQSQIIWEANHLHKPWLKTIINYKNWEISNTNLDDAGAFILKVLKNVASLSKTKFKSNCSYYLKTNLQFPSNFGLGSSSTLMNNLAMWADIDPFVLNDQSLGGSGYDIAVAQEQSSILFQIENGERTFKRINFSPLFKNDLIFIHLNQKMDSREGINHYRSKKKSIDLIQEFSEITHKVLKSERIEDFSELMILHEQKIAELIELKPVKERFFSDCPAFVKSLGAWGGDFVMSCKFDGYEEYFSRKGFQTVFHWEEIINS